MRLALLDAAAPSGWAARGGYVAVTGLTDAFTTAFVTMDAPDAVVGAADDVASYIAALYVALTAAYARRREPLPWWRGWAALVKRWPFLDVARPTRVHRLRPLVG